MEQMSFTPPRGEKAGAGGQAPLAERMRPRTLAEFVGQRHLTGPGHILERLMRTGTPQSLIFWGPPGSGKTTLAGIVAGGIGGRFAALSAVMAGTPEIRAAVEDARRLYAREKLRTWLFMDEIHRLNKAQQDTLLPHVEQGTVLLLGATTENPSFEVIRPLLSRAQVLVLEPLTAEDVQEVLARALTDEERGLGDLRVSLSPEAARFLAEASGGDARVALNTLEVSALTTHPAADGSRHVDLGTVTEVIRRRAVHYDKGGEEHYNLISALHKSLRGSDPDAALYWLARMLEGGEDPLFIARRLIRAASEDVGLADPQALSQAVHALDAYHFLGSPEGELALAQAAVYIALAPKSNTVYTALGRARDLAKKTGDAPPPLHIRNAPTRLMKDLGYGRGYRYPHDAPEGWVPEIYFPEALAGTVLYEPTARGLEGRLRELLFRRRRQVARHLTEDDTEKGGA